ncbi:MAG: GNAT family N-acetyltransferase [Acidobacteriota bacterium]
MDKSEAETQVSMVAGLTATWYPHPDEIAPDKWDALIDGVAGGTPFLRHAWLSALHRTGCASPQTGWHPRFLALENARGEIEAACPLYLKDHSWGEYVFDWAWADAYDQQLATDGQGYYPKLVSAVPFSPITGPRLLVQPHWQGAGRQARMARLLSEIADQCERHQWSSAHALFLPEDEARLAGEQGWLVRHGVQFHWQNREGQPYADFDDFLAGMQHDKRKKIKQERRKVREAGITFQVRDGQQITESDWDFFYRCYAQTYLERRQTPYLSRLFWQEVAQAMPECWALIVASDLHGVPLACALLAVDRQQGAVYGRYWGAVQTVSCLHFETCYYQPLQWCIEQGLLRFEGGAQGEHKLARGLLPVSTYSAHWLAHEGFRDAVARFLKREDSGMHAYLNELDERAPFKTLSPAPTL